MRPPVAVSYSALKEFEECPRRFAEKRVLKRVKEEPSPVLQRGSAIHKALERGIRGAPQWQREYEAAAGSAARPWLIELVETLRAVGAEPEVRVGLTYDLEVVDYWDKDVWFRASFDAVFDGGHQVVDWKTGKSAGDTWQLQLYGVAAARLAGARFSDWGFTGRFVYLDRDGVDTWTFDGKTLALALHRAYEDYERILDFHNQKEWPALPGRYCRWCPARAFCEEGRKEVGE